MEVIGLEVVQSQYSDITVNLKLYINVTEIHEWRNLRMDDLAQRITNALTREFSKAKKRSRIRSLILEKE